MGSWSILSLDAYLICVAFRLIETKLNQKLKDCNEIVIYILILFFENFLNLHFKDFFEKHLVIQSWVMDSTMGTNKGTEFNGSWTESAAPCVD